MKANEILILHGKALKTNRVIYPKGISIQVKDFAQYIKKNDVYLVIIYILKQQLLFIL